MLWCGICNCIKFYYICVLIYTFPYLFEFVINLGLFLILMSAYLINKCFCCAVNTAAYLLYFSYSLYRGKFLIETTNALYSCTKLTVEADMQMHRQLTACFDFCSLQAHHRVLTRWRSNCLFRNLLRPTYRAYLGIREEEGFLSCSP